MWERPLWSLILALLIYTVFALSFTTYPLQVTRVAYYNYLADAFLHGQLHLRLIPPTTHDLVLFEGKYFLYWPPLPAIVVAPFVAFFGVNFSDVAFNLLIASVNVCMVSVLLNIVDNLNLIKLSRQQRATLVLFFALGTVHLPLAPYGRVWSTGQLMGFLVVSLTYFSALKYIGTKALILTGMGLAATILTRNHMIFACVWPVIYLLRANRAAKRVTAATLFLSVLSGIAVMGGYNWLRFGSFVDNGLSYHLFASVFAEDFQRYGVFSPRYFLTNLFYQYVAYPFPITTRTFYGGSLFLLSPVFFAAAWGIIRGVRGWSVPALLASIVLVQIPILSLMGTGWVQFGPRYSLDFTLPLLFLTGMGIQYWSKWLLGILTCISAVQYILGTLYFGAFLRFLRNL
jgi:hypothetical protein